MPERTGTPFGDKVDAGYVVWQKNRAEQRLKLLAKWSPKKYGDRQQVELAGNLAVNNMTEDEIRAELAALASAGIVPTGAAQEADGGDDIDDLL